MPLTIFLKKDNCWHFFFIRKFRAIFWHSNGNFPEGQLEIHVSWSRISVIGKLSVFIQSTAHRECFACIYINVHTCITCNMHFVTLFKTRFLLTHSIYIWDTSLEICVILWKFTQLINILQYTFIEIDKNFHTIYCERLCLLFLNLKNCTLCPKSFCFKNNLNQNSTI